LQIKQNSWYDRHTINHYYKNWVSSG